MGRKVGELDHERGRETSMVELGFPRLESSSGLRLRCYVSWDPILTVIHAV